jgi:hypothetical protein
MNIRGSQVGRRNGIENRVSDNARCSQGYLGTTDSCFVDSIVASNESTSIYTQACNSCGLAGDVMGMLGEKELGVLM